MPQDIIKHIERGIPVCRNITQDICHLFIQLLEDLPPSWKKESGWVDHLRCKFLDLKQWSDIVVCLFQYWITLESAFLTGCVVLSSFSSSSALSASRSSTYPSSESPRSKFSSLLSPSVCPLLLSISSSSSLISSSSLVSFIFVDFTSNWCNTDLAIRLTTWRKQRVWLAAPANIGTSWLSSVIITSLLAALSHVTPKIWGHC